MTVQELQRRIRVLTGNEIDLECLELLWTLFLSEVRGTCNLDALSEKQITELSGIFLLAAQAGEFSLGSDSVKSIKEGDTAVEFFSGTGANFAEKKAAALRGFIARNRRLR